MADSVVDARERILYDSIVETLLTFGDSTRNAFIWQLKKKGIQMTPDKVDLREIESMLFRFFGDAARTIVERICDEFARKALILGYFRVGSQNENHAILETRAIDRFLHSQSFGEKAG